MQAAGTGTGHGTCEPPFPLVHIFTAVKRMPHLRPVAWFLLLLIGVGLAPREVLHHCDGHHHDAPGARVQAACAVSDHALPVAEEACSASLSVQRMLFRELHPAEQALAPQRLVCAVPCRGPPSIG